MDQGPRAPASVALAFLAAFLSSVLKQSAVLAGRGRGARGFSPRGAPFVTRGGSDAPAATTLLVLAQGRMRGCGVAAGRERRCLSVPVLWDIQERPQPPSCPLCYLARPTQGSQGCRRPSKGRKASGLPAGQPPGSAASHLHNKPGLGVGGCPKPPQPHRIKQWQTPSLPPRHGHPQRARGRERRARAPTSLVMLSPKSSSTSPCLQYQRHSCEGRPRGKRSRGNINSPVQLRWGTEA